ncbi:MAG: hypothetical protein K2F61_00965 [Muribaculaceae bacterium]|nr:hypothetical protein [Muribaculaceae bacterium]
MSLFKSIVFLTSIVQSGLPFFISPQTLTINGFTGAIMSATFGPAVIGECLRHTIAKNVVNLSRNMTDSNSMTAGIPSDILSGLIQRQALVVSMKEIYGWLLFAAVITLLILFISYSNIRPWAIFPRWSTIRKNISNNISPNNIA